MGVRAVPAMLVPFFTRCNYIIEEGPGLATHLQLFH